MLATDRACYHDGAHRRYVRDFRQQSAKTSSLIPVCTALQCRRRRSCNRSVGCWLAVRANTTYGENTGVLELSHVHDPRVIRIAAVFAVILSFIPKMADVIGSMPSAIIGGVSFMLYGMISAIGVRNVVENHVDLTKSRNLVIAAVILVCGLGFSSGLTFTVFGTSITLTGLAIAALAGIILNAILPGNDYEFGKDLKGDINRGVTLKPNPEEIK